MKEIFVGKIQQQLIQDKTQFSEIPGAKDFFENSLNRKDWSIGIATGAWEETAKIKLGSIGIDPTQVCFSNSNYHKTREAITTDVIHQIKSKTNINAEEIIYFGDGLWDYNTCNNLGIKFIGIDFMNNGKLRNAGAPEVFKDFTEVNEILKM